MMDEELESIMPAVKLLRDAVDHLSPTTQATALSRAAYEVMRDDGQEHDDSVAFIIEAFDECEND